MFCLACFSSKEAKIGETNTRFKPGKTYTSLKLQRKGRLKMLRNKEDKLGQAEGDGFRIGRGCGLSSGALWNPWRVWKLIFMLISVTVCGREQSLACKASWRLPL